MSWHFKKNKEYEFEIIGSSVKSEALEHYNRTVDCLLSEDAESEHLVLAVLSKQEEDKRAAEGLQEYESIPTLKLTISV